MASCRLCPKQLTLSVIFCSDKCRNKWRYHIDRLCKEPGFAEAYAGNIEAQTAAILDRINKVKPTAQLKPLKPTKPKAAKPKPRRFTKAAIAVALNKMKGII